MKKLVAFTGFALATIFGSAAASAQKTLNGPQDRLTAVVTTMSHHFGSQGFNEFNPGLGAEYRLSPTFHIGAGAYHNSVKKLSAYALVGAETNGDRFLGAGVEAGVVSGYLADSPVIPSALPYIRIGKRTGFANAKIGCIPNIKDVTPTVLTLQVRINPFGVSKRAR